MTTSPLYKKPLFAALLITAAVIIVYGNTLNNSFIGDAKAVVLHCPFIRSWYNLPGLFNERYFRLSGETTYRPVVTLSYMLDYTFWKLNAFGYHLTNIFLHALNGILLFALIRMLTKKTAVSIVCALLFVVHPITSEAVNAVGFREDLLTTFFMLLSLLAYRNVTANDTFRAGNAAVCLMFLVLALFAKELALILPVLFLLSDACFSNQPLKTIQKKLPLYIAIFAALCAYSLVRFHFLANVTRIGYSIPPFYYRVLTQGKITVMYLMLLILPARLSAQHTYSVSGSLAEPSALPALFIVCALLLTGVVSFRYRRDVTFGIWWFLAALAPASNIIPLFDPVAERFLYLPAIGFCFLAALSMETLFVRPMGRKKYIPFIMFIVLFFFYSNRTIMRNLDWKTPLALWSKTVETTPHSPSANNNLGIAYYAIGRKEEALAAYKNALEAFAKVNLRYPLEKARIYNNLGVVYYDRGSKETALRLYKKSITVDPYYADAYSNLGIAYFNSGKKKEAKELFLKALTFEPKLAKAYNNLGVVHEDNGDFKEAVRLYKKAIMLNPDYLQAYDHLGDLLIKNGRAEEAVITLNKLIAIAPLYAEAYNHLGRANNALGKIDAAIAFFKKAVMIKRDYLDAYNNLGISYYTAGEKEKAISWFKKAIVIQPRPEIYNNLGIAYHDSGRRKEAVIAFKKAIAINADYAEAHMNLAKSYYRLKEYPGAIAHCDKAIALGAAVPPELLEALEPYRSAGRSGDPGVEFRQNRQRD